MLVTSYSDLLTVFSHLVLSRAEQANLHDVWKLGAPSPDSIIRNPKEYDERITHTVKRIIPGVWLHPFIREVSDRRGIPLTQSELDVITNGGI